MTKDSNEKCRCGRDMARAHCPACGRIDVYPRLRGTTFVINKETGEKFANKEWRCRGCSLVFTDEDRYMNCEAPAFIYESVKQRRQIDAAMAALGKEAMSAPSGSAKRLELLAKMLNKGKETFDFAPSQTPLNIAHVPEEDELTITEVKDDKEKDK